uniref:Uncharacterized protein n=1 Tax=Caenorhabditis japonica TaxID=281687 RepID=A0A8R1HFQ9_CAEJA
MEALYRFSQVCTDHAELVMSGGKMDEEWKQAAEELKREVMERNKPKKAKIAEKNIVVGPRQGWRSRSYYEFRNGATEAWAERFDWSEVQSVIFLTSLTKDSSENEKTLALVEKIAKDVTIMTILPVQFEGNFLELAAIADYWSGALKTTINARVVDPVKPVGSRQTPLILSAPEIFESRDRLIEYMELAVPDHEALVRLRTESVAEPHMKRKRVEGRGHAAASTCTANTSTPFHR